MNEYEVLLVVDGVNEKIPFEKYLKKEGFLAIEGEDFAYQGRAHLPLMNTRAYIFDVLKKALKLSHEKTCKFICKLGENPLESYEFVEKDKDFRQII
ncbi:MAG: hypothetical protein CR967_00965 [Proteobacteria bacterium]|nr:MAG: hypothetical protein CR967_00965 [Pseudomonadota bacterium]